MRFFHFFFAIGAGLLASTARAEQPDWTQPYIGAQIGYSWDQPDITVLPPGLPVGNLNEIGNFGGAIGGVQGGKNFIQQNGYILGIVADFNWLDASGESSSSQSATELINTCDGEFIDSDCFSSVTSTLETRFALDVEWKASIRSKAGVLVAPNFMIYATAGVAFAQIQADASVAATLTFTPPPPAPVTISVSESDREILTGVVGGFGAEALIAPNIGIFAQVLHYEFGDRTIALLGSAINVDLSETVVQGGVSFYFN